MTIKKYNSNATLFFPEKIIDIFFEDWNDYSRDENEENLIDDIESKLDRSLSSEEREEILNAFAINLNLKSKEM